tara:strand:- start:6287 stop:6493 length:207 start_codon:yes stop_codon:yes gene_type:complete
MSQTIFSALATAASFSKWDKAQQAISEIIDCVNEFKPVAQSLGVRSDTIRIIEKRLNQTWQENKHLLD